MSVVAGLGPSAFNYLRELAANQTKAWFEANRTRYETEVRGPAMALTEHVGAALATAGLPLSGDAKRSMFRINRDVRFSKDKRPYKTHLGMIWMRPGFKKMSPGILYLHVADDGCFVAAGFYGLERPMLDAIRGGIRDDGPIFLQAVAAAEAAGLALDTSDCTVRMPLGFETVTDPALVPAIKSRHLVVRRALTKKDVASGAGLVRTLVAAVTASVPLLEFGWEALAESGPAPEWSRLK